MSTAHEGGFDAASSRGVADSGASYTYRPRAVRWLSGRKRRFAKPLYGLKPVPGVRIPSSPPVFGRRRRPRLASWRGFFAIGPAASRRRLSDESPVRGRRFARPAPPSVLASRRGFFASGPVASRRDLSDESPLPPPVFASRRLARLASRKGFFAIGASLAGSKVTNPHATAGFRAPQGPRLASRRGFFAIGPAASRRRLGESSRHALSLGGRPST